MRFLKLCIFQGQASVHSKNCEKELNLIKKILKIYLK